MSESFVVSGEVSIWTTRDGEGNPAMLCNGGAGCCEYLALVAEMLDDIAHHPLRAARLEACRTLPVRVLGKVWQR